jgi:hypothetical protein
LANPLREIHPTYGLSLETESLEEIKADRSRRAVLHVQVRAFIPEATFLQIVVTRWHFLHG